MQGVGSTRGARSRDTGWTATSRGARTRRGHRLVVRPGGDTWTVLDLGLAAGRGDCRSRRRQADQPQRQFGGQVAVTPGIPLSTRTASGRPAGERAAEHVRIAVGGTFCQRPGGEAGWRARPPRLVGEGQPTNALAAGQADSLLGIDLPDLMGHGGSGSRWGGRPWRSRAIDSSRGRPAGGGEPRARPDRILLAQLDTNDPCPHVG